MWTLWCLHFMNPIIKAEAKLRRIREILGIVIIVVYSTEKRSFVQGPLNATPMPFL